MINMNSLSERMRQGRLSKLAKLEETVICFKPPASQKFESQPLNIIEIVPQTFDVFEEGANAYLDDHGYVVFKNVCSTDEIASAQNLLWNFLA